MRIIAIASGLAAGFAALLLAPSPAAAQSFPSSPVRVIVPFPPGGPVDVLARALGERFRAKTGQPFIIENKPGANTAIAAQSCKSAPADGYTICMLSVSTISINPFLYSKLAYDPVADFQPITNMVTTRQVLILQNSVPVNTFTELVEYSKQNPDKLNYGSFGVGGLVHLAVEWLKNKTGAKMLHVPFTGVSPALIAFERSDVQLLNLTATPPVIARVRAGQAKAVLVLSRRNPELPNVPADAELGLPPIKFDNWFGAFAPAGTPMDRVELLNRVIVEAIRDPAFLQKYPGFDAIADSVADFQKSLVAYRASAEELVRDTGIRLSE